MIMAEQVQGDKVEMEDAFQKIAVKEIQGDKMEMEGAF